MIKIKSVLIIALLVMFSTNSCTYQKMNALDQKKFHIMEFEIEGDARETFIIQKKIQRFSNKESKNKIKILIKLKNDKSIKEKNIQNKVVKYELKLSANLKIIELGSTKEIIRNFSANQIFTVEDRYSNTVNNEKEANNLLIDKIVNEILDQLRIYYS